MSDERIDLIERAGCGYCKELLAEVERLREVTDVLKRTLALTADGEDNLESLFLATREENQCLRSLLFEAKKSCVADCICGSDLASRIGAALKVKQ